MASFQNQQPDPSANELYASMWKHMYFGSLVYWGHWLLQGQQNWLGHPGSLQADIQRSQEDTD